ncbi:metal ABC transporter solute-binding protein, Zn/Mn family [Fructilactobacillus florum]|uniref:metal ABC transporter solute-binding protein, Zn/Mn family n=1 Tax=Fructilactobacillus florum TaxID=640331 RepID=UPI00028D7BA5|nr:zinc ABC transporter substrate-binding protein [Fructilactobacillus florum]EKK20458.1 Zinc ABC transporter, periplasmic-binding protein ZnuA [Fructilactobacillus florum 2F]
MLNRKPKLIGFTLVTVLALLGLTACHQQSMPRHRADQRLKIVSTLNFYGETAQQVGGKYVKVDSIINSNVDPHDFEPNITDSKQVAQADLVISNGLGYDDWINQITNSTAPRGQTELQLEQLLHKKDGDNEHLWYDPQTMDILATQLAKTYSAKNPRQRRYFQNRARAYRKNWAQVTNLINEIKPLAQHQKVAVSEPVFNYSLKRMGYQITDNDFANAVDKGVDPAPKAISNLQSQIKNHQIAFFVNNTQTSDPTVANLVKLAHHEQLPVVNVTETKPQNRTYFQWMRQQYQAVQVAQRTNNH